MSGLKDIGLWVSGLKTREITAEFGPSFWPLGIMKIKQAQPKETLPFLSYKFKLNFHQGIKSKQNLCVVKAIFTSELQNSLSIRNNFNTQTS